jgi:hypothetical protein
MLSLVSGERIYFPLQRQKRCVLISLWFLKDLLIHAIHVISTLVVVLSW